VNFDINVINVRSPSQGSAKTPVHLYAHHHTVAYRGGYSEGPPKSCQTQPDCEKCYKLLNLGRQHPKMFGKKGSKILKLPRFTIFFFALALTNKLVIIINILKVPKIKKILLYEMKFLISNYSFLQNPWLGGYRPEIPFLSVLCPQLNLLTPLPLNKIPGYATAITFRMFASGWHYVALTGAVFA